MVAKDKLRVGLVGCGGVAQQRHIPALRKAIGAEIVAVCDMNGELARDVAARFGIGRHYADFAHMLEEEKLDIADITVSPHAHAPLPDSAALVASGE